MSKNRPKISQKREELKKQENENKKKIVRPQKRKEDIKTISGKKGKKRRIKMMLGVFFFSIMISLFLIVQTLLGVIDSYKNLKVEQNLYAQEQQRKEALEVEIQRLDNPEYVKQYAREVLNYTGEDEILFIIREEQETGSSNNNGG